MRSTDEVDRLTAALFARIAACAARLAAEGKAPLPLRPDPSRGSYFEVPPRRHQRTIPDLSPPGDGSPAAVVAALCAQWEREGLPELAGMREELLALAEALAAETTTDSDDVSPFVYAMF